MTYSIEVNNIIHYSFGVPCTMVDTVCYAFVMLTTCIGYIRIKFQRYYK